MAVVFVSFAADFAVLAVFVAASEDIAVVACTGGGVAAPVQYCNNCNNSNMGNFNPLMPE